MMNPAASYVRGPAVAGRFYEAGEARLRAEIEAAFRHRLGPGAVPALNPSGPRELVALVSAHAGYVYSGPAAARGFAALAADGPPEVVVILGPDHTGAAVPIAVSGASAWRTPLGEVAVDADLSQRLVDADIGAAFDDSAHAREHSLEVQVPFLQYLLGEGWRMAGVVIADHRPAVLHRFGEGLAAALQGLNAVIIASTDFSHYVPHEMAERMDRLAIEAILDLDGDGLLATVSEHGITMCGSAPVAAALFAARELGARSSRLLGYMTSGDTGGDYSAVVGYGSIAITRGAHEERA
jgi:AmmeMemoRadiSam system protein B